jgi:hypothetical protein
MLGFEKHKADAGPMEIEFSKPGVGDRVLAEENIATKKWL